MKITKFYPGETIVEHGWSITYAKIGITHEYGFKVEKIYRIDDGLWKMRETGEPLFQHAEDVQYVNEILAYED